MRISIRRTFGDAPEVHDLPWAGSGPERGHNVCDIYRAWFGVSLKGPTPAEKPADLPLIGFCAFTEHDHKGPPGCRRGNMHPEGLWAIALDFDDADPAVFARVLENAKRMSPQGLVHTTWKHGLASGTRARIVMPLPLPTPPNFWVSYWEAVVTAIGAREPGSGLDMQCHNPERLWYLPCTNLDAPAWAPHLEVWG